MVGETRNPPTHIQRPFANAVSAREMTKTGKMEEMKTTRDSAAIRSRNNHIIQVKNADAVGRKLQRKYVMTEKITEMRTVQFRLNFESVGCIND